MKIFVTGATGFVGSHLTDRLLKDGHEVYALVRNPSKVKITHPNLHLVPGDLSDHDNGWENKTPAQIDCVIHTAGLVHSFNTADFYNVNTKGTERLIQVLKNKANHKLNFILISSLAAAGPSAIGVKRHLSDMDFPVSEYGRSKKNAETYLQENKHELWNTVIIRPPMVIGPRDTAVLDIFKMVKDGMVVLPGVDSKSKEYSFVFVLDLVETIIRSINFAEEATFYSAFNQSTTFFDLIKAIQKEMGKKSIIFLPLPTPIVSSAAKFLALAHKVYSHQLRLTPDKIKELTPKAWTCDNSETVKKLNQTFEYSLEKTINLTYQDYKINSLL